ncbi:hypothetical protein K8R47_01135 [archaeon]|nr:hypothetical protein [archaeon]
MNKKGDIGLDTIAKYSLILIGAIVLILVIAKLIPAISYIFGTQSCEQWVAFQSSAQVVGIPLKSFNNPCETNEQTIKSSDFPEDIYEKLGDSLDRCWTMYGSGKINFFSDFDWGSSNTHCFVCDEITVNEKAEQDIDMDDFEVYLSTHSPRGSSLTYAERLLDAEHATIDFGEGTLELRQENPLYSMFVVNKRSAGAGGGVVGWFETLGNGLFKTAGVLVLGSQIPGIPKGTVSLVSRLGTKSIWVAVGVVTIGTAAFIAGDGSELFPSIFLINGEEIVNQCDPPLHYNPISKNPTLGKGKII